MATSLIVFQPVGDGDYRGTVEATFADASGLGAIKQKSEISFEGTVSEFAFGKNPFGLGRAPRLIRVAGATLVKK